MKAISVFENGFRLYADSSVHRSIQPVFLPDVDGGWSVAVCPCVRLSRLGMHIAEKFAPRYYDSVSAAAVFMPTDSIADPLHAGERYYAMDSAFAPGEWQPCNDRLTTYRIDFDSRTIAFTADSVAADKTIAALSSFMTFKMGDILIFPDDRICAPIAEGSRIKVEINGNQCLDIKVK